MPFILYTTYYIYKVVSFFIQYYSTANEMLQYTIMFPTAMLGILVGFFIFLHNTAAKCITCESCYNINGEDLRFEVRVNEYVVTVHLKAVLIINHHLLYTQQTLDDDVIHPLEHSFYLKYIDTLNIPSL